MGIIELKEAGVKTFIKQEKAVVIVHKDGCGHCTEYLAEVIPLMENITPEVAFGKIKINTPTGDFYNTYLEGTDAPPVTLVFADGILLYKTKGKMNTQALATFIETGRFTPVVEVPPELRALYIDKSLSLDALAKCNKQLGETQRKLLAAPEDQELHFEHGKLTSDAEIINSNLLEINRKIVDHLTKGQAENVA